MFTVPALVLSVLARCPFTALSTQSRAAGDSEPHPSTFPGGGGGYNMKLVTCTKLALSLWAPGELYLRPGNVTGMRFINRVAGVWEGCSTNTSGCVQSCVIVYKAASLCTKLLYSVHH